MRSFSGQSGQVSALSSCSGGIGMISSWVIESAPWRLEVPMQSEPVSPPPMTTTCLPLAVMVPLGAATSSASPAPRLFCWVRNSMAKWTPAELAAGDRQVARVLGAAGQHHGVVAAQQLVDRHVLADLDAWRGS